MTTLWFQAPCQVPQPICVPRLLWGITTARQVLHFKHAIVQFNLVRHAFQFGGEYVYIACCASSLQSSGQFHSIFTMRTTLFALVSLVSLGLATPTPRATKVKYAGVNIAGFDFGCTIDGTCSLTGSNKPYDIVSGANALGQMNHFVKDDTLNTFRLPVGWQFLVNGQLGGQYVFGYYFIRLCLIQIGSTRTTYSSTTAWFKAA